MTLALGMMPPVAMADVTIEGDGETEISLTTTVPELSSITVTPPTKTQYNVGEELDTAGMSVTATYTDDSTKDVTSAATLSGFDSSAAGEVTVTVSYTEDGVTKTAEFTVTVVQTVATTYTISVSADPAEGGTVSGGGTYDENASVTVTATANEHYSFVRWTEGGTEVSTSASYTFDATANRTLVAVFEAEEVIYTVTVKPGDGTGDEFTVDSSTVISRAEMMAGSYDQTKGCFYLDDDGKVYYRLPPQCSFTAPEGKEFDCWECSFGGTFSGGSFPVETYGNFTITALWKTAEPQSSVTLSIPATINVKYGDTQTAFDIQVKDASFTNGNTFCVIRLFDSSFTCTSHDGTIPFTVTINGDNVGQVGNQNAYLFKVFSYTELPHSWQGFINITGNDWAAAKPGSYTATLRIRASW